jgi:hypothetical protein
MKPRSPILDALDLDSYDWLSTQAPELMDAIAQEVAAGKSPEQIRRIIVGYIGPDRLALAERAAQAAAYVERTQR